MNTLRFMPEEEAPINDRDEAQDWEPVEETDVPEMYRDAS